MARSNTGLPNLKRDLQIGKKAEKEIHPLLENIFNQKIIPTDTFDEFCNFDFISEDKNIWIEHKNRTNYNSNFNTYFFDLVKLEKFRNIKYHNKNVKGYIIWSFKDCRKIWKITDTNKDKDGFYYYYIQRQNRDRGKGYKQITDVVNVFNDKTQNINDFKFNQKLK